MLHIEAHVGYPLPVCRGCRSVARWSVLDDELGRHHHLCNGCLTRRLQHLYAAAAGYESKPSTTEVPR